MCDVLSAITNKKNKQYGGSFINISREYAL